MDEKNENSRRVAFSLRNVGLAYPRRVGFFHSVRFWALKDVSFDIYHGETLGVIGRNGAGKSTLLRLLAGITCQDKGEIINDSVTTSLLSLQVGFIQYLTGRENVILSGMIMGMPKAKILGLIDEICAYSEIGEAFDQPVHSYSSGMRARLGFSIAIHINPDVILIDEVMGVGDADFKRKSFQTIKRRMKEDKTVILVSHSGSMVRQLCDRVIWIEDGSVKMEGEPSEILDMYQGVGAPG